MVRCAAAAAATLVTGFVLSLGPDGVRAALRDAARATCSASRRSARRRASPCSSRSGSHARRRSRRASSTDGPRGRWIGLGLLGAARDRVPTRARSPWTPAPPTTSPVSALAGDAAGPGRRRLPADERRHREHAVHARGARPSPADRQRLQRPAAAVLRRRRRRAVDVPERRGVLDAARPRRPLHRHADGHRSRRRGRSSSASRSARRDGAHATSTSWSWSPEVEARLGEPAAPVPPPPGPVAVRAGRAPRLRGDVGRAGRRARGRRRDVRRRGRRRRPAGIGSPSAPARRRGSRASSRPTIASRRRPTTSCGRCSTSGGSAKDGARSISASSSIRRRARPSRSTADGQPSGPPLRVWPEARDAVAALYYVRTLALTPGAASRSRSSKAASTRRSSWSRAPSSGSRPAARRSRRGASRRAWNSASSAGRCRPSRCGSSRDGARRLIAADIHAVFGNLRVRLR